METDTSETPEATPKTASTPQRYEELLEKGSIEITPGVFPLGASLECVDAQLRLRDRHRRLNLAGLLDSTPPRWVHLEGYRIGRTMVSNGEYREFLLSDDGAFDDEGLWTYVWDKLDLEVVSHPRYDHGVDGEVRTFDETHVDAHNFVEAYVDSLEYEVRSWADYEPTGATSDGGEGGGASEGVERIRAVGRVFAFVKYLLSDAIVGDSGETVLMSDKEEEIQPYLAADGQTALERDVDVLRRFSVARISQLVPPLQRRKLQKSPHELVEAIALLERVLAECKRSGGAERLALQRVLYPRTWATPEGERPSRGAFTTPSVPWESRPVYGITLYEAAAYCAWLSNKTGWKYRVDLPNEAQYERAAAWPNDASRVGQGRMYVDPRKKDLFPWQQHSQKDFNDFFGQEQSALKLVYADPTRYADLLRQSARKVGDEEIHQLLGFGWQWCRERFDNAERRYARFESHAFERYETMVVQDEVSGNVVPVYLYKANTSKAHSFFVVRGAPEILGGPGLTTRRFAMYPLRAYPNVGFRWVYTSMAPTGTSS